MEENVSNPLANAFRQGKFHQCDSKAQKHLAVCKSLHLMKPLKHKIHAQKHIKGHQKLPYGRQAEGRFILHHTLYLNLHILLI